MAWKTLQAGFLLRIWSAEGRRAQWVSSEVILFIKDPVLDYWVGEKEWFILKRSGRDKQIYEGGITALFHLQVSFLRRNRNKLKFPLKDRVDKQSRW